ncbi:hypothetical protein SAMN04489729_3812 [Amycolatopsis lurida]|uniref:Lipoprotein n=1 Tax=Amycolatopsis lurida NRRL 2430 TaxID=1460371 RepID=A0A2P2G2Z1_AMYLU|nr:hypothetical protein [Amycolatopsis lurida]KFU83338.1 hypothetical protein BB31_02225 [Amycolatopsis lurida NRRL 2430]SED24873.1 hypothetical protein SAMN04489729_3812 [Amycolatopsis lurida]
MRTKAILLALLLVLSGCGSNEVPVTVKPTRGEGPDVLPIKLKALSADQCYLAPGAESPKGCQKYVTELFSAAGTIRKRRPDLSSHADALERPIAAFRTANCQDQAAPGGPCGQTLGDMATALTSVKSLVDG